MRDFINGTYTLYILLKITLLISLFAISFNVVYADTYITSSIATSTTWDDTGNTYIIPYGISVDSGVTLTIEPGVIIKFEEGSFLDVNGTLNAEGTPEDPIFFTSIKDDSVGGDSNGDASSTSPSVANWEHIHIYPGAEANFSNTVIRYGGRYVHWSTSSDSNLYNTGGVLTISSSTIDYGVNGIHHKNGTSTIENSIINNQASAGIYKVGGGGYLSISSSTLNNAYYGIIFTDGQLSVTNSSFIGNTIAAAVGPGVEFTHSDNTASNNTVNAFYIGGALNSNRTWFSDGLPYVISGLLIENGSTLTLEPGVIIKFEGGSSLEVNGILNVEGTPGNPVYFTSIKDDSVGGDTNNDGNFTSPSVGNWENITVSSGGVLNLNYSIVRYGGRNVHWSTSGHANIYNRGGEINIGTSSISHGTSYNLHQESGTTTIWNSHIENSNSGTAAYNQLTSTSTFIATNNYWGGGDTGPYHWALNPAGEGSIISDYIDFSPWMSHYLLRFETTCIALQPNTWNQYCNSVENGGLRWGWHGSSTQDYLTELDAAITTWDNEGLVSVFEDQISPTVELRTSDFTPETWRGTYTPPITGSSLGLIQLNTGILDYDTSNGRQNTWTHELGHALGLSHSISSNVLYYSQTQQTALGVQDKSDYNYLWGY